MNNEDRKQRTSNSFNQQIELLDEQDMNEWYDMEGYEFLKEEFNKLIELDPTIEFPYWIRLHSTAEHLISQIWKIMIQMRSGFTFQLSW